MPRVHRYRPRHRYARNFKGTNARKAWVKTEKLNCLVSYDKLSYTLSPLQVSPNALLRQKCLYEHLLPLHPAFLIPMLVFSCVVLATPFIVAASGGVSPPAGIFKGLLSPFGPQLPGLNSDQTPGVTRVPPNLLYLLSHKAPSPPARPRGSH